MIPAESSSTPHPDRVVKAVLVMDVVESVRLIEANEEEAVQRWQRMVEQIKNEVLARHGGRLVKSLGDGLMLEFPHVQPAIAAAFAIQRASAVVNADLPASRQMLLRVGAHVGTLISDDHDVYGHGVNLAARLTTLAGPGEIVVSADVREQLTAVLDADIEDLGECYLKHVREPVRAYRVGPPGPRPVIETGMSMTADLRPAIAVIPFTARGNDPETLVLGEIVADEVISSLSRTDDMHVISRLSTTAFRDRAATLAEIGALLHANYILSGSYRVSGTQITLAAELAETKSGHIVWSDSLRAEIPGVLSGEDELVERIVLAIGAAIVTREIQRAQSQPLPTLESYTLLMGSIALMHRLSPKEFERAREMLQALIDRLPRQAIPRAWLAKWHVMRVWQGWSDDPQQDARRALDDTKRALDVDPRCSLALAIDGLVHTNLLKRLDVAADRYQQAIDANPNDSLAWLLKGTLHAFKGEGGLAVAGTTRALRLSPLDPVRYYYDSLAAAAALSADDYEGAIELARRSLRANRTHSSTLRALAVAQWQAGRAEEARATVAELMRLEPTLTVSNWIARSPTTGYETGRVWSTALRMAGVPE